MSGFLGTRGTFMLDLVFTGMLAIVPLLVLSVALARYGRRFVWHKWLQLVMAGLLLLAVGALEVDVRLNGWSHLAQPSPYWREGAWNDAIDYSLAVHLLMAVPTLLLWTLVVVRAVRNFPQPPSPAPHSSWHRRWGMLAACGMGATAVTGWLFYFLAFVAA